MVLYIKKELRLIIQKIALTVAVLAGTFLISPFVWANSFDGTWRGTYQHAECWDADIEIHVDNGAASIGLTYLKEAGVSEEMSLTFPGTLDAEGRLQAHSHQIQGPKNMWHVGLAGRFSSDEAQITYEEKEFSECTGQLVLNKQIVGSDPFLNYVIDEMMDEKFHALVIGNNNYQNLPKLRTPINDARGIGAVLEEKYGFEVTTLLDTNRVTLLETIHMLRNKLTMMDNLLIYYAGHGELDEVIDKGYWLPVDAKTNSPANWISNSEIADALRGFQANHILLIVDSCYSGTLLRSNKTEVKISSDRLEWIKRVGSKFSRTALTSGSIEPVVDEGGGGHSIFARYLLKVLKENKQTYLLGKELFDYVKLPVSLNAEQMPQYADIYKAGSEGGDFIFIKKR